MDIDQIKQELQRILDEKIGIVVNLHNDFLRGFQEVGLNSLLFVKLLVNVEIAINIEFEEEFINITYLKNLQQLAEYIYDRLKQV